jgi:hypothetical protein
MTLDLAVGQNTYATQLPKNLVAWHSRDSAGAITGVTASPEVGWIRIDSIPIRNGYHYLFVAPEVNITVSATTAIGVAKLRYNLSGVATVSSSQLPYGGFMRKSQPISTTNTDVETMTGSYHASADGTMSVIMTIVQGGGTGTVGLFASASFASPLFVYEMGLYPAASGVDL